MDKSSNNHARFRRDFWDLFSGYSLQSTVTKANENYKKSNKNFQNIRMVEKALIARQKIIVDKENAQSAQILVMHQNFVFSEMQLLSEKNFTTLVGRLQFSLGKINKDPIFTTIMTLATKKEYCLGLTCFSNPIFSRA